MHKFINEPEVLYNLAVTQEKYTCSDQCRNDGVNSSGNELKAVDIVMLGKITANEREDGHRIVQEIFLQ